MKSLSLLVLLLLPISAPAAPASPADRVANVKLSAIAWDVSQAVVVKTAGRPLEWEVPAFGRSQPLDYSGDRHLVFFKKDPADEKGGLQPLAEVELPAEAKKVLLLFFPSGQGTVSVYPIRDDGDDYQAGRARLMNVTARPLAVKTGGDLFTLAPGEARLVSGDGVKLSVRLAVEHNGVWRQISSNVLPLGATQRRSVFFTTTDAGYFNKVGLDGEIKNAGRLKIFSIED